MTSNNFFFPKQLEEYRNQNVWLNVITYTNDKGKIIKAPRTCVEGFWQKKNRNDGVNFFDDPRALATADFCIEQMGRKVKTYDANRNLVEVEVSSDVLGISLGVTDLVFVDFDHILYIDSNGKRKLYPEAKDMICKLNSYTEFSVSGTGIHVLYKGNNPLDSGKGCRVSVNESIEYELYSQGRICAVTGKVLPNSPNVAEVSDDFAKRFFDKYFKPYIKGTENIQNGPKIILPTSLRTDEEIFDKIRKGANSGKILALMDGNLSCYGNDESRADLALASYLAYYTNNDFDQIESIMSSCQLCQRRKWQTRADYRRDTINKAIRNNRPVSTYTSYTKEQKKAYAQKKSEDEFWSRFGI